MRKKQNSHSQTTTMAVIGDPNGVRTHVIGVRGQRPRPLDYRATMWRKLVCLL